ncbi:MAG: 30S ribosomal protein S1 [Deltaproteobacteria bacterium]|nr:30S ribosomal protein S1 [Deltaproteobacteria bacterium]
MSGKRKWLSEKKGFLEGQGFYEESIRKLREGEILRGKVVCITQDAVIVDIGYKSEGRVPIEEFAGKAVNVGDELDVFLEGRMDENGFVVLSKVKANQIRAWDEIAEASSSGKVLEGRIVQRIKGGFNVDMKGVAAFLPGSHVDIGPVRDWDSFVGRTCNFKVLQFNKGKGNVIVSRRVAMEEDREKAKIETMKVLTEDQVMEGTVKNITDYGAFIDLSGIDGLLHITDMSWGRISHPSQIFSVGDKVTVKVLKFNKEEGKVSLGFKQLKPDPWTTIQERYPTGTRVNGKVVSLTDYGAFVEIEERLEGLLHISEMSWIKLKHPSQRLRVGDMVEVMVLDVDTANKKMSLGLKQLEPNPWDLVAEKYPRGTRIKGVVKNITDFGIFVGVEEGIDGLVHISDISWKKVKHPTELFQKGQEVEVVVLNIDKANERFSLGIKQLEKDPWKDVDERYRPGTAITGKVVNITEFGAFIELEEGVEGLLHISELNRGRKRGLEIKVGDEVDVEVLNVNPEERKIGLSIRSWSVPDQEETKEDG